MLLNTLRQLLAYHHWATDRLFDALRALPPDVLDRPLGGSFGSPRGLLAHIVGAELVWVERWQGRSPSQIPDAPAGATVDHFLREWATVRDTQERVLLTLDAERLAAPLTYTNFAGHTWTYPFEAILIHVANHGTYHRGQLAHVLRQLGQVPPSTDYLRFCEQIVVGSPR